MYFMMYWAVIKFVVIFFVGLCICFGGVSLFVRAVQYWKFIYAAIVGLLTPLIMSAGVKIMEYSFTIFQNAV